MCIYRVCRHLRFRILRTPFYHKIFFAKWVIVQGVGWQKVSFFSYVVMLLQYFALILDK